LDLQAAPDDAVDFFVALRGPRTSSVSKIPDLTSARWENGEIPGGDALCFTTVGCEGTVPAAVASSASGQWNLCVLTFFLLFLVIPMTQGPGGWNVALRLFSVRRFWHHWPGRQARTAHG
jgi:hypothetical protein